MNNNTKISIIISISSNLNFTKKCLDTLRFQTYKNLEFICINSSLLPEIQTLLYEYKNIDNRFKIITNDNNSSLLSLVDYAKGEYISFINSDHWVLLNLYQAFVDIINILKQEIDIYVFNSACYIDGQNDILPPTSLALSDWNNHLSEHSIHTCKDCKKPFSSNILLENKIFRKDFIRESGEPYGKSLEYQKRFAYLKYLLNAKSIILNNDIFYRFRLTNTNTVSDCTFEIFEIIDNIEYELTHLGLYETFKYAIFQFKYKTFFQYYALCPEYLKQKYFETMKNKLDYKYYPSLEFNICQNLSNFGIYQLILQSNFENFNIIYNKRYQ